MTFCFFILLIVGFFQSAFSVRHFLSHPNIFRLLYKLKCKFFLLCVLSCFVFTIRKRQQTIVITSPSNYCRVVYGTVLIVSHWWSDTVVSTECLTVPYDPVCYIDMIYSLLIFREKSHKIFANHFFSVFIFFLNFLKVKHIYVNLMYQTIFCQNLMLFFKKLY